MYLLIIHGTEGNKKQVVVIKGDAITCAYFLGSDLYFEHSSVVVNVLHFVEFEYFKVAINKMRSILDQGIDEYLQEQDKKEASKFEDDYIAKTLTDGWREG